MQLAMVDLKGQYQKIQPEIDAAVLDCMRSGVFIGGPVVAAFQKNLEEYLGVKHVVPCANGTDALQIAMMALGLQHSDEVIVPAFTYVATAEVIALLGLKPVLVDVDPGHFNISAAAVEAAIGPKTKAIVPVHLFGQSAAMWEIMQLTDKYNLYIIEDNAQAVGADYIDHAGQRRKTGTIGHFGCTSFFPSKNLGCYGDGGALMTNDDDLAARARQIANHGQSRRYYHDVVGVNSRLDAVQAAILNVKLGRLDAYNANRRVAADQYDAAFSEMDALEIPVRSPYSTHVFHQYTLKIKSDARLGDETDRVAVQKGREQTAARRDQLIARLAAKGVPAMIYYPVPLYRQKAFAADFDPGMKLANTESLCASVFSLPIHTEMNEEIQNYIIDAVRDALSDR